MMMVTLSESVAAQLRLDVAQTRAPGDDDLR